jgi:hypothetical protein
MTPLNADEALCVPRSVHLRLWSQETHSPTSSGSAFPIKNGPDFSIGPNSIGTASGFHLISTVAPSRV